MLLSFPTLKPLFLLIAESISLPNYRNFQCAVCIGVFSSLREDLRSGLCAGGTAGFHGVCAALASGERLVVPVRTLSASHPASASQGLPLAPGTVATVLCAPLPVWSGLDPLP